MNIAVGAGQHGIDSCGDIIDHEECLGIEVPVNAQGHIVLLARSSAAGLEL